MLRLRQKAGKAGSPKPKSSSAPGPPKTGDEDSYYTSEDSDGVSIGSSVSKEEAAARALQGAARSILARASTVTDLSHPVIRVLHRVFDAFDTNKDGVLSLMEFQMLYKYLQESQDVPAVVASITKQRVLNKDTCMPLFSWYARGVSSNYHDPTKTLEIAQDVEASFGILEAGGLVLEVVLEKAEVKNWPAHNMVQKFPNLFATLMLNDKEVYKTKVFKNVQEAEWMETVDVRPGPAYDGDVITFIVWDQHNMHANKEVGRVAVKISQLRGRISYFYWEFAIKDNPARPPNLLMASVRMK